MKPAELARLTVETYIKTYKTPPLPELLDGVSIKQAGAFVSIKTLDNELRGCIGTILATESIIQQEIINNAVSAATRDPRFPAVSEGELENLKYSVDILNPPEKVSSLDELDPKNYGIIVISETGKQGLLLPDLEGVDTVEQQILICQRKAGMRSNERYFLKKFKVDRYPED